MKNFTRFVVSLFALCCISMNQTWANCNYVFKQDVYTASIHNGEVIYQAGFDNVYGLKTLTFKLTLTCVAAGKDLNYKVQYLPQNSSTWTDSNIKTSTLNGTWQAWRSESSETITYSPTTSDPIYNARGIRVVSTTDFGTTGVFTKKDVYRDVKITDVAFEKATTFAVSTNTLEAFPATVINTTSTTTRSFTINYSNVENLSCTSDNSEFAVSSLSGDVCTGPQTVVVSFTPNSACPATRTATITVTAGSHVQTISVSGEALLMTPTLVVNSDMQNVDLYSTTFPENKFDLSTLITNHIGGELVYAVTVATNGGDISQATLEGSIFYATRSGDYQVIVTSMEDCLYSSATATLNIHVNDKVQPSFILNEDETLQEAYLNVETNTASIALSNVDVSTFTITYDHDILACKLENNIIVVTAKQAGETTISLEQPETPNTYSATRTFTLHITKNTATLTHNLLTDYKVDDEMAFTDLYTATNSEVEVSVLSSDEAVVKVEGDRLHAVGAGTATVTISQAENYKWTALTTEQTVTVSKHANTIVWSFAGEHANSKTLSYDETIAVTCTSDNTDTESSPIAITQTTGEDIATYNAEQQTITASYHNGTTTWNVSQPENYKYLAAEATITVSVAPQTANCYALEETEQHSIGYYENKDGFEYTLNGAGETLSVDIWKYSGATYGTVAIYGYDATGTQTTIASYKADGDLSTSPKTMTMGITSDIVKIKVKSEGNIAQNTLNKYFKNLYITRKQVLTPSATTIALPANEIGGQTTASFALTWSSCADEIRIVSDNPKFTIDNPVISTNGGSGTANITVTYSSDEIENATATLTLYTPYQQTTVVLTATTGKSTQSISWSDCPSTIEANADITINATAQTPVHIISSDSAIAYVENGKLLIITCGTITLTAIAEESEMYESATLSQDITITPLTPEVTSLPVASAIRVGQSFGESVLTGGTANVDGFFIWEDNDDNYTPVSTQGEYTAYVMFVPTNINWYAILHNIAVSVTVEDASSTDLRNTVNATSSSAPQKVLLNGTIYIICDGRMYDMQGRLLRQ